MSKWRSIKSVTFNNARSWGQATLPLSPHVNVFVGESDSGKSNVVRNLRSLIDNDTFGSMARDGQSQTGVVVNLETGHQSIIVSLVKTVDGKKNQYTVLVGDKQKVRHERVGVSVPDDIAKLLGLAATGDATSLHIGDQFEPRFIVGEKASQVAKTIGEACGIDRIAQAAMLASKDARAAKSKAKDAHQRCEEARQSFRDGKMRFEESGAVEALAKAEAAVNKHARAEMLVHHARIAAQTIDEHLIDADQLRAAKKAGKLLEGVDASLVDADRLLDEASTLANAVARLDELDAERIEARREAKIAEAFAVAAEQEAAKVVKKMGVCPTCGRKT